MLDYIKGKILHLSPTDVLIDTATFGYRIQITLHTHDAIKNAKEVKLYTYLNVRNEGQILSGFELFGFAQEIERTYFSTIIGVSGIGTATARLMLSSLLPEEIAIAIANEDVSRITTVKGIGPKTAKRMILELKDKLIPNENINIKNSSPQGNTIANEALSALLMLGFNRSSAQKAIQSVQKDNEVETVEELIKLCLKKL